MVAPIILFGGVALTAILLGRDTKQNDDGDSSRAPVNNPPTCDHYQRAFQDIVGTRLFPQARQLDPTSQRFPLHLGGLHGQFLCYNSSWHLPGDMANLSTSTYSVYNQDANRTQELPGIRSEMFSACFVSDDGNYAVVLGQKFHLNIDPDTSSLEQSPDGDSDQVFLFNLRELTQAPINILESTNLSAIDLTMTPNGNHIFLMARGTDSNANQIYHYDVRSHQLERISLPEGIKIGLKISASADGVRLAFNIEDPNANPRHHAVAVLDRSQNNQLTIISPSLCRTLNTSTGHESTRMGIIPRNDPNACLTQELGFPLISGDGRRVVFTDRAHADFVDVATRQTSSRSHEEHPIYLWEDNNPNATLRIINLEPSDSRGQNILEGIFHLRGFSRDGNRILASWKDTDDDHTDTLVAFDVNSHRMIPIAHPECSEIPQRTTILFDSLLSPDGTRGAAVLFGQNPSETEMLTTPISSFDLGALSSLPIRVAVVSRPPTPFDRNIPITDSVRYIGEQLRMRHFNPQQINQVPGWNYMEIEGLSSNGRFRAYSFTSSNPGRPGSLVFRTSGNGTTIDILEIDYNNPVNIVYRADKPVVGTTFNDSAPLLEFSENDGLRFERIESVPQPLINACRTDSGSNALRTSGLGEGLDYFRVEFRRDERGTVLWSDVPNTIYFTEQCSGPASNLKQEAFYRDYLYILQEAADSLNR